MSSNLETKARKEIRLTSMATCAGCAAKLKPETLTQLLTSMRGIFDSMDAPDLLVGLGHPDDAAVWKLDEKRALIVTTDFFTPVVDDPYDFGGIAAANALSDVYAMGGKPFLALNIAALPNDLPMEIGAAILRGGADKAKEAGIPVAGGHTIQDKEPKYGLVVLGFADPSKLLRKQGARVGDFLYITKPLGFGVTNTAVKRELATPQDEHEVVGWMRKLNKQASELAQEFDLQGGTDITGFGLLGHAWEMASGASVKLKIYFDAIPFTSGATMYAKQDTFPGGSRDNRKYYSPYIYFAHDIEGWEQLLLFDSQTSGGLLLAVPAERSTGFEARAAEVGQPVWRIGEVTLGTGIEVDRKGFD